MINKTFLKILRFLFSLGVLIFGSNIFFNFFPVKSSKTNAQIILVFLILHFLLQRYEKKFLKATEN